MMVSPRLPPSPEEQWTVLNDPENGPWKCDKCLAISLTLTELLETARNLSARVHTLEATNAELAGRMLDLLVNHEPEPVKRPVPDTDSDDPPVETETEVEEMNSATIESAQNDYEQEHQHQQEQTHEMRKQRQQKGSNNISSNSSSLWTPRTQWETGEW